MGVDVSYNTIMIYLSQAVVVEGKYDKIKISSVVKATIVVTDGFRIFKSESKKALIRKLAQKNGIVILTDSDRAGQIIRSHIKSFVKEGKIFCAYVPKILGKEKRKTKMSKSGVLGVEAMDQSVIIEALKRAGVFFKQCSKQPQFTQLSLMEAGLLGFENSSKMRKKFLTQIGLPDYLSTNQLLEVLNATFNYDEFQKQVTILKGRMN